MKKRIFICALLMASALCMTACSGSVSPDSPGADTIATSSPDAAVQNGGEDENYIPEKDADGYVIEAVPVTDAQGAAVTDEAGKAVTELNIVDDKGVAITDASGNKAKPNLPSKPPVAASASASASAGNNIDDTSNQIVNVSSSTPLVSFLWFGDARKEGDEVVYNGIASDTDVMEITFKVKDTAKNGKYEIKYFSDANHSSSFCDKNVKALDVNYCTGVVGVNEEVSETAVSDGLSFVVSSVSAKPGDEIKITCSLKNVTEPVVAFNSFLSYDGDALEPVSLVKTGFAAENGDFASNIKTSS